MLQVALKYDGNVPRYTSYPTAPYFHAGVDAGTYRAWLGELSPDDSLSLYLHVPFCDTMCWFCGCYTKLVREYAPVATYLAALHQEIDLVARLLPRRLRVTQVHWGGGSPTVVAPADFARTMDRLRQCFDVAPDAEIAVEVDPRDVGEAHLANWAEAGVDRVSIGVQDLNPDVQRSVNRIQPFAVVRQAFDWARAHGIDQINVDMMYGLPRQTAAILEESLNQVAGLEPSRLSLFGYAHVPWFRKHQNQIDEAELPDAAARWSQFQAAARLLQALDFRHIGMDHFARPGDELCRALEENRLRRNFQGYTTDRASVLIGLGASSISSLPQGYVQNVSPLRQYYAAVAEGQPPIARGIVLSAEDRLRRAVIERLMCHLHVDLADVARTVGMDAGCLADACPTLEALQADGLVALHGTAITVPEAARLLVRVVAAAFDAYLQTGKGRHSKAV
jgi:oxygen-independent coproporphyrinogen-3 oxidase